MTASHASYLRQTPSGETQIIAAVPALARKCMMYVNALPLRRART